jgi:small-conductance mechanosensitive channel
VTTQPQGRDDPPAVAALAIQVTRLRHELDTLTRTLNDVTATQRRHTAQLTHVAEIRQQIQQILTILDTENDTSPARWFWLTMPDHERDAKLSELTTG